MNEEKSYSNIYNIGPYDPLVSINELISIIRDITPISNDSIFFEKKRPNEVKTAYCDTNKIIKDSGFLPNTSLHYGIKNTLKYIQENNKEFEFFIKKEIVDFYDIKAWMK